MIEKFSALYLSTAISACVPHYVPPPTLQASEVEIDTPEMANEWLKNVLTYRSDMILYGKDDFWASCALTYQNGAGDCEDFAICAAVLLQGDIEKGHIVLMYNPLSNKDEENGPRDHAVFAYKSDGRWGVISNQEREFRTPLFASLEYVVQDINNSRKPADRYTQYIVVDYEEADILSYDGNLDSRMKKVAEGYLRP